MLSSQIGDRWNLSGRIRVHFSSHLESKQQTAVVLYTEGCSEESLNNRNDENRWEKKSY